jgi:Acetyltransferase (GNAT) domain
LLLLNSAKTFENTGNCASRAEYRKPEAKDDSHRVSSGRIFEIDPLRDSRWPGLIEKHSAASVFHSAEWLSALSSAYNYEPVAYTMCEPSAELASAVVFCKVKSWLTGSRLVSLPFSDHCDPLVDSASGFDDILLRVSKEVDDGRWGYCEVRPVRFEPSGLTRLHHSAQYCLHIIDLRPSIDAIFRSFHKNSVQRKIRRAEHESLSYEEGSSERLLSHFHTLLVATRKRHYLPPQPMKWFRSLIASFGENLKIRVAFKNDEPIASILTLSHKNIVTYKYGCSDARYHPLGGMALLFWRTIQEAKAKGFEKLDLGRSDGNNLGLIEFKEHWAGIRSHLYYWRYPNVPLSHESLRESKGKITRRLIEASPDRLLALAGRLFYRHIG